VYVLRCVAYMILFLYIKILFPSDKVFVIMHLTTADRNLAWTYFWIK